MKFLVFYTFDVAKAAEVAKAGDQATANLPPGTKVLAQYLCQSAPFEDLPPNTVVSFAITESDSNEALATVDYALLLAGVSKIRRVPILEMPVGGGAETEKKLKG